MKNILKLGGILILTLSIFSLVPLRRIQPKIAEGSLPVSAQPLQEMSIVSRQLDPRAVVLRDYFAKFDSPLQYYAQDFIDAADAYQVDWKLVPAIAGVESTFGKNTPGGYNGWGWGVYGNQAIYFSSWRDGIFTVTKGLKDNYIDRGMVDPYQINYAYASSPFWGSHVSYFMQDLDSFSKGYQINQVSLEPVKDRSVAVSSAQLTKKGQELVQNLTLAFTNQ